MHSNPTKASGELRLTDYSPFLFALRGEEET